jgi:glycosyltransferase involved in cell wall biosynthesis
MDPRVKTARIIFVTNLLPQTGVGGWPNANCALLDYLTANGTSVHVCCLTRSAHEIPTDYPRARNGGNWTLSVTGYHGKFGTAGFRRMAYFQVMDMAARIFRRIATKLPQGCAYAAAMRASPIFSSILEKPVGAFPDRWDHRHLRDAVVACKPDCVIVDYAFLGPLLARQSVKVRPLQMVLTHDLLHQRSASLRKITELDDLPPMSAVEEAQCLVDADVLVIDRADQLEDFHRLVPSAKLIVAPFAMSPCVVGGPEIEGRCLFVGSEGVHNVISLRWFLERVWPTIVSKHPIASLTVCGAVCDAFMEDDHLRQTPRVDWRGRVDDLLGCYRDAQVSVVPLIAGSGVKTKLIEAMAFGRAVVSTTEGAAGLVPTDPPILLISDEPDGFAYNVIALLRDTELRSALVRSATTYVQNRLRPDTLYRPILELINASVGRTTTSTV